ncbi:MAG TPA: LLM class flavin-dependent oxidoreductase [Pyrinomonadaceae bacterium]|nr:LLM class flavin-dependent oxidoreductase [Pyrinomonadaceae bacterium]
MSDISKRYESLSPKQRELLDLQLRKKGRGQFNLPEAARAPAAPLDDVGEDANALTGGGRGGASEGMDFSLFFFSGDGSQKTDEKYRLLLESAVFADAHGFAAVWTPERHFQDFGGLYPNPSVLAAALAMITEKIKLRAGSVALPLHNPIRVAEEWSVVDNLSHGRVEVSFASGWHPLDFVLHPGSYRNRKELMFENVRKVQKLWAGDAVAFEGVDGDEVEVKILPKPIQPQLPTWITIQGNPESWVRAGEIGANVLTAIVTQPLGILAAKIRLYREARARHGHDPSAGRVAAMLHTFVGESEAAVKEQVRAPLTRYLRGNLKQLELQKDVFIKNSARPLSFEFDNMTEADLDDVAAYAFERYFDTILLCGTPAKCSRLVNRLAESGVGEIACLVDFGLPREAVLEGLKHLDTVREMHAPVKTHAA